VYFKNDKVDHVDKPPEPVMPPGKAPPTDVPMGPPVDTGAKASALPNALIPDTPVAPATPEGQRTLPLPDK
jgi:hypothetical protein